MKELSSDRQLLYLYIVGLSTGDVSLIEDMTIGKTHQARWLTLATRIIRLYVSKKYDKLKPVHRAQVDRLVTFVCHVYFPVCLDFLFD